MSAGLRERLRELARVRKEDGSFCPCEHCASRERFAVEAAQLALQWADESGGLTDGEAIAEIRAAVRKHQRAGGGAGSKWDLAIFRAGERVHIRARASELAP